MTRVPIASYPFHNPASSFPPAGSPAGIPFVPAGLAGSGGATQSSRNPSSRGPSPGRLATSATSPPGASPRPHGSPVDITIEAAEAAALADALFR